MELIHLKNTSLAYEVYGDRKLPPVVLIMGLGTSSYGWPREFIRMLMEKGLQIILVDNRDCGRSGRIRPQGNYPSIGVAIGRALLRLPVMAPYTLEDMAMDYSELLDRLGIESAHIVGASLGGMIAQILATVRPSKVKSLVSMMSASGNPRTGFGKLKTIYTLFFPLEERKPDFSPEEYYTRVLDALKSPNYTYPKETVQTMIRNIIQGGLDVKGTERQLLAILASGDRSEQIKRIIAPTLVIHGEDDPLLPLAAGKEVADLIPGAQLKVLKQMGHDLPPIHLQEMADDIASLAWEAETN